ncbi:hypothetical protein [Brevibacterium litoralis]|uniref:hypothetical protein n=1 Tax=Brevibacterium litoralis TaxID=3138935 RepID=UPI0032EE294D
MSNTSTTTTHAAMDADFNRTTMGWGTITMGLGLVLATYMPFHFVLFSDVPVEATQILVAFAAVAGAYAVFWFVEPITYFPILGPAGMYQAFMIGNISNKLLPAAIVAQSALAVKPGTKKGSYAATAAICGAAFVHVASMLLLVGLLGSWIVSITPEPATVIAQTYILPAILGGVVVQLVAAAKNVRTTVIALGVGLVMSVGVMQIPGMPGMIKGFNVALCVILTVAIVWFTRNKGDRYDSDDAAGVN